MTIILKSSHPTGLHCHFRNPHPTKNSHGDCVTRAISLATGIDYQRIWNELHLMMMDRSFPGTPNGGVNDSLWRSLIWRYGWEYKTVSVRTVFHANNMPELCIAQQANHLVLVAHGSIWDSWDSRGKRSKKLKGYAVPVGQKATIASWIKAGPM